MRPQLQVEIVPPYRITLAGHSSLVPIPVVLEGLPEDGCQQMSRRTEVSGKVRIVHHGVGWPPGRVRTRSRSGVISGT
jgi:hypothetical protein